MDGRFSQIRSRETNLGTCHFHYDNMPMQYSANFNGCKNENFQLIFFLCLAHLSQRLIGELIVYPCSGIRPPLSSSTVLKHLLFRNCLVNQSQLLCGASLGKGKES